MSYKLIIFDMDGTILNTLEDLTDSVNACLTAFSYPTRTIDEVRSFVGNGIRLLIARAVPEGTCEEDIETLYSYFMPYYQEHCAMKTKPYDGILDTLKKLRVQGYKTAVVSNKADTAVQELCQVYFPGLFDFAIGEKPGNRKKPAPDAVNETLNALNIKTEDAIYIGDSDVDLETAANAKMDCIAVEWGFRDAAFLKQHGATRLAQTPEDIFTFLS